MYVINLKYRVDAKEIKWNDNTYMNWSRGQGVPIHGYISLQWCHVSTNSRMINIFFFLLSEIKKKKIDVFLSLPHWRPVIYKH